VKKSDEDPNAFPERLENQIMAAASTIEVRITLAFLIAMQRHILLLMNQLALAEEEAAALRSEKDEQ